MVGGLRTLATNKKPLRYHEQSLFLGQNLLSPNNTIGAPPATDSILINDGQNLDYPFEVGKNYRFRIINMGASASAMIHFDSHDMNVIMNDAAYLEQEIAYQLRVTPAQRYDVIIKGIERDNRNFGVLVSLDRNRDYSTAPNPVWPQNATAWLVMDPEGERRPDVVDVWRPFDDSHFKPFDGKSILPPADKTLVFNFQPCRDKYGITRCVLSCSPPPSPFTPYEPFGPLLFGVCVCVLTWLAPFQGNASTDRPTSTPRSRPCTLPPPPGTSTPTRLSMERCTPSSSSTATLLTS